LANTERMTCSTRDSTTCGVHRDVLVDITMAPTRHERPSGKCTRHADVLARQHAIGGGFCNGGATSALGPFQHASVVLTK
jgi:hypothetical protein